MEYSSLLALKKGKIFPTALWINTSKVVTSQKRKD